MTAVPVPTTPAGCEIAPAGVIPGELVRWRLKSTTGAVTLVLGVTTQDERRGPAWGWVQIHAGPGTGGTGALGKRGLDDLMTALEAARGFTAQDFPGAHDRPRDPEPEPDDGQPSLFEEAAR